METPLSANIIYTYNIRGKLDLLPRLYTYLQKLKQDLPPADQTHLLDLGASCVPDVWPCGPTDGRAVLFVLDAMGYDVVNITGTAPAHIRQKLIDQVMMHIVDDEQDFLLNDICFCTQKVNAAFETSLTIELTPAEETRIVDDVLCLRSVDTSTGQVGLARIHSNHVIESSIRTMPATTPQNPTIAGTVDFVISEARYYEDHSRSHNGRP